MSSSTRPTSFDDRVRLARVRIFFGHADGNMLSIMIGSALLIVVLHRADVAWPALATWGLLLAMAAAGVSWFERQVARIGLAADNCRRLAGIRIGLGAAIALFYGLSGFLLEGPALIPDTFLFIIVSTLVSVAALSYAVMPAYYIVLDAVSLVPLTVHFIQQYLAYRDP